MATAPGISTLTELCGKRITLGNILVIKNIPRKTTSEALERYIEAVCGVSRARVHNFERQVAVVETDSELQDVKKYRDILKVIPLEDTVIKFESGCGVFIKGIPDADVCTESDIFLYFDSNKKSGGRQGCVENVEPPTDVDHTRYAVVRLKHVKALKSILNKREHKLCNQVVEVEPYFPSYHDDLLVQMTSQQTQSTLTVEDDCTNDPCEQPMPTPEHEDARRKDSYEQPMPTPKHANARRQDSCEQQMSTPEHADARRQDPCEQPMPTPKHANARRKYFCEQPMSTPEHADTQRQDPVEQPMSTPEHAGARRQDPCEQPMPTPVHADGQIQDPCEQNMSPPVHRRKWHAVQDDHSCPELSDMSDLTKFTLHGGDAKYFQKVIEPKIRALLGGGQGKLETKVEKTDEPIELSVIVEGDNTVTMEMKKYIEQIWHENVDFRHISSNDLDNKLLMTGLDGDNGRQMFRQFQEDEHCIVYVTKPDASPVVRRHARNNRLSSNQRESKEEIVYERNPERQHRLKRRLTDGNILDNIRDLQTAIDEPIWRREEIRDIELHEDMTIDIGKKRIVLRQGDITKQKADALVNILGPSNSMNGDTAIGKAFLQAGGQDLLKSFEEESKSSNASSSLKNLTITPSVETLRQVQLIVHATLPKLSKQSKCDQAVGSVMKQLFEACETYGCTHIALPPLGIGKMYRYSPSIVANTMLEESAKYLKGRTYLKEIRIVVYDEKTYDAFKQTFSAYNQNVGDGKAAGDGHDRGARPKTSQLFGIDDDRLDRGARTKTNQLFGIDDDRLDRGARTKTSQLFGIDDDRLEPYQMLRSLGLPLLPMCVMQNHPQENQHNIQTAKDKTNNHRSRGVVRVLRRQRPNSLDRQNHREEPTRPQMRKNQERSMSQSKSVLKVDIFAEGKENCDRARAKLSKKIREEFLYEEKMKKKAISKDAKAKIRKVISESHIVSIIGKDDIILKGYKTQVKEAHKGILAIVERDLRSSSDNRDDPKPRRAVHQRETREFISDMVKDEPKTPSYWKHFQPGEILHNVISKGVLLVQGKSHKLVTLDKGDPIYREIKAMTKKTWDVSKLGHGADAKGIVQLNYTRMKVKKIERVENIKCYNKYAGNRKDRFVDLMHKRYAKYCPIGKLPSCNGHVTTALPDSSSLLQDMYSELNEHYFFHGTKPENIQVVCNQGLDPKLASGNAMLGQGIYGAESSIKADQYADDQSSRSSGDGNEKKMFLIRMLLGNVFLCSTPSPHKYCRPPCTGRKCHKDKCKTHQENFDSVISDNGKLFREFVVYESSQSYPEYLITYVRL